MPQGAHEVDPDPAQGSQRTITEFIYAPSDVPDGFYFLNLQLANFRGLDAVPSTPYLFRPEEFSL